MKPTITIHLLPGKELHLDEYETELLVRQFHWGLHGHHGGREAVEIEELQTKLEIVELLNKGA